MTYNPNLGRWLQVDPIGFDAGDVNLYRMEGNEPTNASDPSGLQEKQMNPVYPIIIENTFKRFMSSEKAKRLFDEINKNMFDGKLKVVPKQGGVPLGAQIDPKSAEIQIDIDKIKEITKQKNLDAGRLLYYILIEVVNASNDSRYAALDKAASEGKVSRKDYAEQKERIEYDTQRKAQELYDDARKAGKWPESANPHAAESFEKYLETQRKGGHTQIYEKQWDEKFKKEWEKKHPPCNPSPDL